MERRTDARIDRRAVGLVLRIAAVERGANFRHPVVLDGGPDVPVRRLLETGSEATADCVVCKKGIVNIGKPDIATALSGPEQVVVPVGVRVVTAVDVADAILGLNGKTIALRPAPIRQVEFKPAHDGEAPLVVGMSSGVKDTVHHSREYPRVEIGARAIVMQDGADLRPAPGLVEADGADDVWDQETGIGIAAADGSSGPDLEGVIADKGGRAGDRAKSANSADVQYRVAENRVVLHRDGGRDAVPQLLGIAIGKDADAGVVSVEELRLVDVF